MFPSDREWDLRIEVDGEGVVRVSSESKILEVTPGELGLIVTAVLKAVLAQEGDDRHEIHLN